MENLQIFNHPQFGNVEVLVLDGKEWFGATQIAIALSYTNPHKAVRDHCREEGVTIRSVLTDGGHQQMKFINEGNLYRLITRSRLPDAEKFESYVFDEVLPTIRKHGAYMTPQTLEAALNNPDTMIQVLTRLKHEQDEKEQERQARIAAEFKLDEQRPLVAFAETCLTSNRSLLVREVAKLASKQGVMIGEKRLYQKLREWGMMMQLRNEPTQRAMEMGLFEIKKGAYQTPEGARDYATPKVTVKGQMYIIDRLQKERFNETA